MFDRVHGRFIGFVGRGGDERGDLRRPAAIARFDSGTYVIFDQKRKLLAFRDLSGAVLTETPVTGYLTGLAALPGAKRVLLAGDGGGGDVAAVIARGMQGEAAPAGTDLDHVVAWLQAQLFADAVELARRGLLEGVLVTGVQGR